MSFVALANWHAYCVITYELICNALCILCTMFRVLRSIFRAFAFYVLCLFLIATSFLVNKDELWRWPRMQILSGAVET